MTSKIATPDVVPVDSSGSAPEGAVDYRCDCGCGSITRIATRTRAGKIKGRHHRYIYGHRPRVRDRPRSRPAVPGKPKSGPPTTLDSHVVLEEWDHFGTTLGWSTTAFARHLGYTPEGIRRVIAERRHLNDPRGLDFDAAWDRDHQPPPAANPITEAQAMRAGPRLRPRPTWEIRNII